MARLTERRRAILSEEFGDLANYALAALVFSQAVGQESFSIGVALAGFLIWFGFTAVSYVLAGGSQ
jgi:hypothetical protein